jgi:flagellar basal body rod protein FlgG
MLPLISFFCQKNLKNYTTLGFKKIRAPEAFYQLIKDFWESNKHLEKEEDWVSSEMNSIPRHGSFT